jgi:hypothetical protein
MLKLFLVLLSLLLIGADAKSTSYVLVTKATKIFFAPNASSKFIANAKVGDVFEFGKKSGAWIGVFMFSGEYRYIAASKVKNTKYSPSTKLSESQRRALFVSIVEAEDKAMQDADSIIPDRSGQNYYANIDLNRILGDRYRLEIFRRYRVQAPDWTDIKIEGWSKGWIPR